MLSKVIGIAFIQFLSKFIHKYKISQI